MAALYKAQDNLTKAVSLCRNRGYEMELSFLGDGRYQEYFVRIAQDIGIRNHVNFVGRVPSGKPVREQLDKADLFVLPSLTEGLPRSLIEAMARGLPCIGSNVGGIPELLPERYLVEPGNVKKLAEKIISTITNTEELKKMASRNLQKAKEFHIDKLSQRRTEFYRKLADISAGQTKGNVK